MTTQPAQLAADDQQEDPFFVCSVCGEPVVVFGGKSFHTCSHTAAEAVVTERGLRELTNGLR